MKTLYLIIVFLLAFGGITYTIINDSEQPKKRVEVPKYEYQLEILNQDWVKIRRVETGRIYIVPFDEVHEALLKDNL